MIGHSIERSLLVLWYKSFIHKKTNVHLTHVWIYYSVYGPEFDFTVGQFLFLWRLTSQKFDGSRASNSSLQYKMRKLDICTVVNYLSVLFIAGSVFHCGAWAVLKRHVEIRSVSHRPVVRRSPVPTVRAPACKNCQGVSAHTYYIHIHFRFSHFPWENKLKFWMNTDIYIFSDQFYIFFL